MLLTWIIIIIANPVCPNKITGDQLTMHGASPQNVNRLYQLEEKILEDDYAMHLLNRINWHLLVDPTIHDLNELNKIYNDEELKYLKLYLEYYLDSPKSNPLKKRMVSDKVKGQPMPKQVKYSLSLLLFANLMAVIAIDTKYEDQLMKVAIGVDCLIFLVTLVEDVMYRFRKKKANGDETKEIKDE
eukprot:NODE_99_length_20465_cov_0.827654.p13 type:complete len:186 gc:universal NODE_99_length_20465_cov_0.827654:654-97(-)